MILTGSEDIRVKKTMISIRNAFCDMICEMDYELKLRTLKTSKNSIVQPLRSY